jgi:hypothetical protein
VRCRGGSDGEWGARVYVGDVSAKGRA